MWLILIRHLELTILLKNVAQEQDGSFDLTATCESGARWVSSCKIMQETALAKIREDQPLLIIGASVCTNVSSIMNLNWTKLREAEKTTTTADARRHLEFCINIYTIKHEVGRYALREHPLSATSWNEFGIIHLFGMDGIIGTNAHICRLGFAQQSGNGPKPVKTQHDFSPSPLQLHNN